MVPAGTVGVNIQMWLHARDEFVKQDPADVTAFVKSLLEGKPTSRCWTAAIVPVSSTSWRRTTQNDPASWDGVQLAVASPDGTVNAAAVEGFETYLVHAGAVKKHVALSSLIDTTYLDRATKDLK